MIKLQEFIKKNYYNSSGKAISARWNERWHKNNGYENEWVQIHSLTAFLDDVEHTIKDRVSYILSGDLTPNNCLKCGNHAGWMYDRGDPYVKRYCSQKCAKSCDIRAEKIRVTHLTEVDQEAANRKRRETMKGKFGYEYTGHRPGLPQQIAEKNKKRLYSEFAYEKLHDKEWLTNLYVNEQRSLEYIGRVVGVWYGTIADYLVKYGVEIRQTNVNGQSSEEKEITEWLESEVGVQYEYQNTDIIKPKHLDIVLHDYKLAIEYNGVRYHTVNKSINIEVTKPKNFHLTKTELTEAAGYQLLHIDSCMWFKQKDIVKSLIRSKIGKSKNVVYARDCTIKEVTTSQQKEFFNGNHLQGYARAKIAYGLFDANNTLVAAMSFGSPRYNKQCDWELIRLSYALDTIVVGGSSRLLKHFRKFHSGSILTYCDRMISNGKSYFNLGFKHIGNTEVGYYWMDMKNNKYHRSQFMKKDLHKKLKKFDPLLSEHDNMIANGYGKYYTSGNMIFILE